MFVFTLLALGLAAVAFSGFISNALRLNKAEALLNDLQKQLEPPPKKENRPVDYRHPAPREESRKSDPPPPPKPAPKPVEPKRRLIDQKGKAHDCPFCNGLVFHDPTYHAEGCNEDPTICGRTMAHLHQKCTCGAIWACLPKT